MNRTVKNLSMGGYVLYMSLVVGALCGLTFLLSSCDNALAEEGNYKSGREIAVNLSLGNSSYHDGENMGVRSYSGDEGGSETVVVPVGDDFYLYGTMESDPSERRRGIGPQAGGEGMSPVDEGTILHVIAYEEGSKKAVKTAAYVIDNGEMVPVDGHLKVPEGRYDFVVHSSTSDSEPAAETSFRVHPNELDLMWGRVDGAEVSAEKEDVVVQLRHMFSKVRVVVKTGEVSSKPKILVVGDLTIGPSYNGALNVETGGMQADGNPSTLVFPMGTSTWSGLSSQTVTSPEGLLFTGGAAQVYATLSSITLETYGKLWLGKSYPIRFNREMEGGKAYTLTISLKKVAWAGSNIYWDGSKLTFDEAGNNANNNYQGVYFKWGSLVGISPVGQEFTDKTPIYVPMPEQKTWFKNRTISNVTLIPSDSNDWAEIPCAAAGSIDDRNGNYLADMKRTSVIGDICDYIGVAGGPKGYRMPKSNEFGPAAVQENADGVHWAKSSASDPIYGGWYRGDILKEGSKPIVTDKEDGTTRISQGAYLLSGGAKLFFPASGNRADKGGADGLTDGGLSKTGASGFYWAGSNGGSNTYSFVFTHGGIWPNAKYPREFAYAVRCVKE